MKSCHQATTKMLKTVSYHFYTTTFVYTLLIAWKECIDKQSGFPYYWNLHTDEVTWEMPEEYKSNQEKNKPSKKTGLYIPPKSFSGSKVPVPSESVKIYKIESERTKPVSILSPTINKKTKEIKTNPKPVKKFISSTVDSDEE